MIDVHVEIKDICWENDDRGNIAWKHGTDCIFQMTMFESENLENKIKEHLHKTIGHRPKSWHLYEILVIKEK